MAYSIVEFEDGILTVPTKWHNGDFCKYPLNERVVKKSVMQLVDPEDNWDDLVVLRVFGTAETYKEAEQKAELALVESDLEEIAKKTTNNSGKISAPSAKHKPKQVIHSDSSLSDDSDSTFSGIKNTTVNLVNPLKKSKNVDSLLLTNQQLTSNEKVDYISGLIEENGKKLSRILLELADVRKLAKNSGQVTVEKNADNPTPNSTMKKRVDDFNSSLPLNSEQDLINLNNSLLADLEFKKQVSKLLTRKGGKDALNLLTNIMGKLMTRQLKSKYSFCGGFKQYTAVVSCIIEAIHNEYENITEHQIELKIGSDLAQEGCKEKKKEDEPKKNKNPPSESMDKNTGSNNNEDQS